MIKRGAAVGFVFTVAPFFCRLLMITMKDWLAWRYSGIDVFKFTKDVIVAAFASQSEYKTFPEFLSAFRFFVAGNETAEAGSDVEGIRPEVVFSIIARVPDWQSLTWHDCVLFATASAEAEADGRSQLLCMIHNVHCTKQADLRRPMDFNTIRLAKRNEADKELRKRYCGEDIEQTRLYEFMKATEPKEE